jgi:adenylylsulfate kinase-like enzyme
MYKKARAGAIRDFTGIKKPRPVHRPDVTIPPAASVGRQR